MLSIKIYGSGCARCMKLAQLCDAVVKEEMIEANIEKITDIQQIISKGILETPALEINEKIILKGRIPTRHTLIRWLKEGAK